MSCYDLNLRLTIGSILSGNCYTDLETILETCEIPVLNKKTF